MPKSIIEAPLELEEENHGLIDPDPWTLVQTVCAIAGAIGVFIQIGMAYRDRTKSVFREPDPDRGDDLLRQTVREAIHNIENLVRFLARAKIEPQDTLDRRFRYAETTMLIERSDFGRFRDIADSLANSFGLVQGISLTIIQHQPEHARRLGIDLAAEVGDFAKRINSFTSGEMTNAAVIDECLLMIRSFNRILERLAGN